MNKKAGLLLTAAISGTSQLAISDTRDSTFLKTTGIISGDINIGSIEELEQRIEALKNEIEKFNLELEKFDTVNNLQSKIDKINSQISDIDGKKVDRQRDITISVLNQNKTEEDTSRVSNYKILVSQYSKQISKLESIIEPFQNKLNQIIGINNQISQNKEEIDSLKQRIKVLKLIEQQQLDIENNRLEQENNKIEIELSLQKEIDILIAKTKELEGNIFEYIKVTLEIIDKINKLNELQKKDNLYYSQKDQYQNIKDKFKKNTDTKLLDEVIGLIHDRELWDELVSITLSNISKEYPNYAYKLLSNYGVSEEVKSELETKLHDDIVKSLKKEIKLLISQRNNAEGIDRFNINLRLKTEIEKAQKFDSKIHSSTNLDDISNKAYIILSKDMPDQAYELGLENGISDDLLFQLKLNYHQNHSKDQLSMNLNNGVYDINVLGENIPFSNITGNDIKTIKFKIHSEYSNNGKHEDFIAEVILEINDTYGFDDIISLKISFDRDGKLDITNIYFGSDNEKLFTDVDNKYVFNDTNNTLQNKPKGPSLLDKAKQKWNNFKADLDKFLNLTKTIQKGVEDALDKLWDRATNN